MYLLSIELLALVLSAELHLPDLVNGLTIEAKCLS